MKTNKRRSKYIPPETRLQKREKAIKRELAVALYEKQKPLSMRQLAHRMKISPSSSLMNILCDMAERRELVQRTFTYNGGACKTRNLFALPHSKIAAAAADVWR